MKCHTAFIICGLSILGVLAAAPGPAAQCRTSDKENTVVHAAVLPGGHRGAVNALAYDDQGRVLSAGADGFLEIWDVRHNRAAERFQVSLYPINAMVLHPLKPQVALIERDNPGVYRISAWNYESKRQLFTLGFSDPIAYINYSAGGNFLMVERSDRTGLVFIHPETGEMLESSPDIPGTVSFAATGRSERTMITYMPAGVLSYWDLESGKEIRHFIVPPHLTSLILFGTNRFLGGIDPEGLVILDAVSGTVITRDTSIFRRNSSGILLPFDAELSELVCLSVENGVSTLYHLSLSASGRLETKNRRIVSQEIAPITSAVITQDTTALGTGNGRVWRFNQDGTANSMMVQDQQRIAEVAASGPFLALRTGEQAIGFIPLDYTQLEDTTRIHFETSAYTHLASNPGGDTDSGSPISANFLLWHEKDTRRYPVIKQVRFSFNFDNSTEAIVQSDTILDKLSSKFPLRSAAILGDRTLFLDSAGNITVISRITGDILFSFSSIGSFDAAFLDGSNIIIGRSAVSGNTPFLMVNMVTGETVPLAYPASIGVRVYRGASGTVYGAVVDEESRTLKTALLRLNTTQPARSDRLAEYPGEDIGFGMAESGGLLASTLGGAGASIYTPGGIVPFERSPGLPLLLVDGSHFFIALDGDGTIGWHDPQSGKLLALFHLYEDAWILERADGSLVQGGVR
jgi:hypothetical protein